MAFEYEKLAAFINGLGRVFVDATETLPEGGDERDSEVALLRAENVKLREALAQVELILTGLRGAVSYSGDE